MKILVIEDEQIAADKLIGLINQYDLKVEILGQFDTVEDTVLWLRENENPDLLFLDIHLADGSSFEIFEQVDVDCPIIFTTAYDQYAIQAFKTKSVDYLLKPITFADLKSAMDKYQEIYAVQSNKFRSVEMAELSKLIRNQQKEYKLRFLVKVGKGIKSVPTSEVAYFQFEDRTTLMVTKNSHRYPVNYTLDELEDCLNPVDFIRANRQFVIHVDSIDKIHPWFNGRLKLELRPKHNIDLVVPVGRVNEVKDWLGK